MATQPSILAWKIPWTEEPGGLQSMGLQRTGHVHAHTHTPLLDPKTTNSCQEDKTTRFFMIWSPFTYSMSCLSLATLHLLVCLNFFFWPYHATYGILIP